MEKCLETVHEITKLIKQSPKRDSIFKHIKHDVSNDGPEICLLVLIDGLYETSLLHQFQRTT